MRDHHCRRFLFYNLFLFRIIERIAKFLDNIVVIVR